MVGHWKGAVQIFPGKERAALLRDHEQHLGCEAAQEGEEGEESAVQGIDGAHGEGAVADPLERGEEVGGPEAGPGEGMDKGEDAAGPGKG